MAGAEARAVWQRTVNRCFVQEDAKRAPKFNSSSRATTTKQDPDRAPSSVLDPLQNQSSSFMPHHHRNQNFTDLSPHNNTRLWNHHHHIKVNQKPTESEKPELGEPKSLNSESFQEFIDLMETRESYGYDDSSEKKLNEISFDPSSPWNSEKVGPWWRTADKDELASLVAQRSSLDYIENCDLPTPQKLKRSFGSSPRRFGSDYSVSNQTTGPSKNRTEETGSLESGLSKSELLEALRRSQTRAREAENMAKEAYAEKEHLVKLLFKQASELFGYKQWLQLLQLEALYLQIKNKKKKIEKEDKETPVSSSIPWSKPDGKRRRSNKRDKKPNDKPVYAVGLVLGMSLVGAGLLLGWTVGWMQMLFF